MVTSDKKAAAEYADRLTRYSFIYLAAAIFCALFGAIYEFFSHGVFSFFMIYAFAIPLAAGAFPLLWIALRTRKHTGQEDLRDCEGFRDCDGMSIDEPYFNETGIDERRLNEAGIDEPYFNEAGIDEPYFNEAGTDEPCCNETGTYAPFPGEAAEAESDGSETWFMDIVRDPENKRAESRRRIPVSRQEDEVVYSAAPKRMFHFPGSLELNAWGSGIAAMTVGSIFRGVLDIYGTTNKLVIVYPVVGTVMMTFGLVSFIMGKVTIHRAAMKKQPDPLL